jgi:hypothetical protein
MPAPTTFFGRRHRIGRVDDDGIDPLTDEGLDLIKLLSEIAPLPFPS